MVIGRRWAARGWPRGRRRRCARARGPARRLGTDIHKLGPQEELDVGDDPSHTRSWPGTENTADLGRVLDVPTHSMSAWKTQHQGRPRAARRQFGACRPLLRPPERHARATRVRAGSRPVRLNEVAAVDGPQARKTKKFSRKDAAPTKKNWWAIDPWYVRGTLSAEALD